jgi:hypothetical protein
VHFYSGGKGFESRPVCRPSWPKYFHKNVNFFFLSYSSHLSFIIKFGVKYILMWRSQIRIILIRIFELLQRPVFEVSVYCAGAQRYWLIVTWHFETAWQMKCPCQPLKMKLVGFATSYTNYPVTRPQIPEVQQQVEMFQ